LKDENTSEKRFSRVSSTVKSILAKDNLVKKNEVLLCDKDETI
jgi:hypothetical protein